MDREASQATVHRIAQSRTRLNDFTFTFHFHALEKEMATHLSVLAWRIPGTGGAWWAAMYGVAESRTQLKRLSSSSSLTMGFPDGSNVKASACSAGDLESIPGLGRSPGGGHGNPLQCSRLENPMDRGAWLVQYMGSQSRTRLRD